MKGSTQEALNSIRQKVLAEIKPSKIEIIDTTEKINNVMDRLAKIAGKKVELRVVGSVARGTHLKGDADIDIFMLFDKNAKRDQLTKFGLSYGKKLASGKRDTYEIKYAEHPYIRVFLNSLNMRIDLVPALKISNIEQMGTSVDRTPLHADFINSRLSDSQRDDTRVLKYLLKSHHIYGAEAKTGGFPGYLCELLIIQFGSLAGLIEEIGKLKPPLILDPKNNLRIEDAAIVKKFDSQFIVIDPVDSNRNVAAGVSPESFAKFMLVCRTINEKPQLELFYGKGFSSLKAPKLLGDFIKSSRLDHFLIVTEVPEKSEDTIWPQVRKMTNILIEHMSRYGFTTYFSVQWTDKDKGFTLIVAPKLEIRTRLVKGPDIMIKDATDNFVKKHSSSLGFLIKGSTIYSLDKNRYMNIEAVIRDVIKGRVIENYKDVNFKNAEIFVNEIPREYSEAAYSELMKKLTI